MRKPTDLTAWVSLVGFGVGVVLLIGGYHRSLELVCFCRLTFCNFVSNIWNLRWVGLMGWPFIVGGNRFRRAREISATGASCFELNRCGCASKQAVTL